MTPERITHFCRTAPMGAVKLALMVEQGLGSTSIVASWSLEEIRNEANPLEPDAVRQLIEEAAQEHCNSIGDPTRFLIQWHNKSGVVCKSLLHKVTPEILDAAEAAHVPEAISANRIVSDLLNHIGQQQKTMQASFGIVMVAYEKAMRMQQTTIEALSQRLHELPEPAALSGDEAEVVRLKAAALTKLIELGPDVAGLGIAALAKHFGLSATNGAGGAE